MTQKFEPGEIIVSDGARGLNVDLNHYLQRHLSGDWGDNIPKEDWAKNDAYMKNPNASLYSWYDTSVGRLQIVTYIGHYTSIFLPSEY